MFFFNKKYGPEWIIVKITKEQKEEVINKIIKYSKEIYDRINSDPDTKDLPDQYKTIIFHKLTPTFESVASDILDLEYIKKTYNK